MSDVPVPNGSPPTSGPEPRHPAAPLPPPRVPDHELIRRIGRGAYGEVWLARSVTGAFRAVKIVHRQSFDHDRPFEREFEGILKFEPISRRHESQVDILHVGRGDDCFYYVMELADDQASGGQINPDQYTPRTLKSDLLFHGRLPFEECVRIGLALATALENLHGNGLAHRDVKPSNIIFVNGVPKLADIGLVAAVEATRSYVGTEGFAAPEGPGSAQADLYSLGKVLYEISTGKDRQEFPELPTQLRELPDREGLMELNAVIARACRHDPKDRYASATAMRADLELLQSGKSLARLHRTQERLRLVQHAGAVAMLLAALAAGLYFWQARQTKLVRDLATENSRLLSLKEAAHGRAVVAEREALQERDRARHSEQDTHRVLQFLLRRVVAAARPQDEDEGLGRDITVLQALQAAEPAIPEAFAGQPQAELELRQSLAATFRLLRLATNEVPHQQRALELSERLLGPDSPEALTNRMGLAFALRDAGLTNEYLAQFEQTWQTASKALGADNELTLEVLGWLGVAYRQLNRGADSVRLLEAGVQRCRAASGEDDLRTLDMVNHLAWSYHLTGQNERAVPLLEQTQRGRERLLGREHEETTRAMIDLGRAYQVVGREGEAFGLLVEAYEIRRRRQGPQHQATLIALDALALSCERAGRTNDALAWHTQVLDLRATKFGPNNASTVRTRNEVFRLRAALAVPTNPPAR